MKEYTEEDMKSFAQTVLFGECTYSEGHEKYAIMAIDEYLAEWKKTHETQNSES